MSIEEWNAVQIESTFEMYTNWQAQAQELTCKPSSQSKEHAGQIDKSASQRFNQEMEWQTQELLRIASEMNSKSKEQTCQELEQLAHECNLTMPY